ncbi:unnamed protein product [Ectocarpus sp. CCAP 1310/34]|nr:unnamed protein product [Ectocarpus sp. CCAP 1310/34]
MSSERLRMLFDRGIARFIIEGNINRDFYMPLKHFDKASEKRARDDHKHTHRER